MKTTAILIKRKKFSIELEFSTLKVINRSSTIFQQQYSDTIETMSIQGISDHRVDSVIESSKGTKIMHTEICYEILQM